MVTADVVDFTALPVPRMPWRRRSVKARRQAKWDRLAIEKSEKKTRRQRAELAASRRQVDGKPDGWDGRSPDACPHAVVSWERVPHPRYPATPALDQYVPMYVQCDRDRHTPAGQTATAGTYVHRGASPAHGVIAWL